MEDGRLQFLKDGPEVYQDVLINGEVVQRGVRECASRYEALKPILNSFKGPFTVLDVGANLGYFGLSILRDYPQAVVVMIDSDHRLHKMMTLNSPERAVVLERRFTVQDFKDISECEHFDLILMLNVLHHMEGWEEVLKYCLQMGSQLVVEVPDPKDEGACNNHVLGAVWGTIQYFGKCIAQPPSHTSQHPRWMYLLKGSTTAILKSFIDPTHGLRATPMTPESVQRPWYPGINLWTYHVLGGVYPVKALIIEALTHYPMPAQRHGDVRPWNFILGDGLHLIDGNDERANFQDEEGRWETIRILRQGV